jgi:hypothetical protein
MKDSHFSPTPQAWRGAAVGVFLATLMLISLSTIDLLQSNVSMGDASIYFAVGSLIAAVFGGLLVFLSVLSARIPTPLKWAIACFAICAYYFFTLKQSTAGLLLIGIWTIASFSLACGSFWSLLTNRSENKKRLSTLIYFFLGLLGIAFLLFWLNAHQSLSLPTTLEGKRLIQPIELPDPALTGNFVVKSLSYGNINDSNRP